MDFCKEFLLNIFQDDIECGISASKILINEKILRNFSLYPPNEEGIELVVANLQHGADFLSL